MLGLSGSVHHRGSALLPALEEDTDSTAGEAIWGHK